MTPTLPQSGARHHSDSWVQPPWLWGDSGSEGWLRWVWWRPELLWVQGWPQVGHTGDRPCQVRSPGQLQVGLWESLTMGFTWWIYVLSWWSVLCMYLYLGFVYFSSDILFITRHIAATCSRIPVRGHFSVKLNLPILENLCLVWRCVTIRKCFRFGGDTSFQCFVVHLHWSVHCSKIPL